MKLLKTILSGACLVALVPIPANAAVVTVGYWRGGENDVPAPDFNNPGGGLGFANSTTIDIAGSNDLNALNNGGGNGPYYSSTGLVAGSTSSYAFDPGAGNVFSTSVFNTATFNWGIQAYTTTSQADSVIISNGDANLGGYGIIINNGKYSGLMNGITVLEGTVAATGAVRNVALVNHNGTLQLYIDGVLDVSSNPGGSNTPAGNFAIGAAYNGNTSSYVNFANGSIDEVRIFTFNTGEFSASDLTNYVVPEPSSALLLIGAVGSLVVFRRRHTQS